MGKRKIHTTDEWNESETTKIMRRLNWERSVAEMRDGRRDRATTFTDRRKQASRNACRKNRKEEW